MRGAILLLALMTTSCFETEVNQYPNLKDAVSDGAVQRGWVPDILPRSAKSISEKHDFATNEIWARFEFDVVDRTRFIEMLERVNVGSLKCIRPPSVEWWPDEFSSDFSIYRTRSGRAIYFAVSHRSGEAFYWSCAR